MDQNGSLVSLSLPTLKLLQQFQKLFLQISGQLVIRVPSCQLELLHFDWRLLGLKQRGSSYIVLSHNFLGYE